MLGVAIHRERACAGIEQELAGAWGPAEREALQKSFAGRAPDWAPKALAGAMAALDRYAAGWVQMKTQACEATRQRGAQLERILELRDGCLDLRRRELKSVVELLSGADEQLQRAAVKLAGGLSSLSGCADIASLAALVPPGDPETQAKVKELGGRLAEARVLVNAGRFSEAGARATKLVAEADALAYQPLIAELSLFQGEMEVYTEHHESTQQTLLRAVYAAEAGNAAKLAAKGWRLLALSQNQKGDAATAEQSISTPPRWCRARAAIPRSKRASRTRWAVSRCSESSMQRRPTPSSTSPTSTASWRRRMIRRSELPWPTPRRRAAAQAIARARSSSAASRSRSTSARSTRTTRAC